MAVTAASGLIMGGGCKTGEGSGTQSLDNFARGAGTAWQENSCGTGTPEVEQTDHDFIRTVVDGTGDGDAQNRLVLVNLADPARADAAKAALKQSLAAVPTFITGAFFALGGRIDVREDAAAACSSPAANLQDPMRYQFEAEGNRPVTSCVRDHVETVEVDGADRSVVTHHLYLTGEPAAISHALVRGMALALTDKLARADLDADRRSVNFTAELDQGFAEIRSALAEALLKDTSGNATYDLSFYKQHLGTVLDATEPTARLAAWQAFKESNKTVADHFENYVFVESFDSFYCSGATRASMEQNFGATFAAFGDFTANLEQLKAQLPKVESAEQLVRDADKLTAETKAETAAADKADAAAARTEEVAAEKNQAAQKAPIAAASASVGAKTAADGMELRRGRILGGLGRAVVGVGRGAGRAVVRVGVGAGRVAVGAGRVAVGAARVVGRTAVSVVRATGRVVRAAGRVVVGVVRTTGRVVGRVIQGGAALVGGAVRGAAHVTGWVIGATGQVVRGIFGAFAHLAGCIGIVCSGTALAAGDIDDDGIRDEVDRCFNTGTGAPVHKTGDYAGCAAGQYTDESLAAMITQNGYEGSADQDGDGVINDADECSATPTGLNVHRSGEWTGCGQDQRRDADVLALIPDTQS